MCIYRSEGLLVASNNPHPAGRPVTYNSDAHVITQGLGQNRNTFPRGIICDDCNSYFGSTLEPALLRHPTLASDMHRLNVPGKAGTLRPILGNWRRSSDGSYWVPMAPPENGGEHLGKPLVIMLPILDPQFDQFRFRRGLHMLAFNVLSHLHASGQVTDPFYNPRDPRYDAVRTYIRAPKSPREAWPFVERYDPPPGGGQTAVHVFPRSDHGLIGRIRAFSFEFYVDLLNTGKLLRWIEAQGLDGTTLVPPGTRYPASPTMKEVLPEKRWWLRLSDGKIQVGTSGVDPAD